MAAPHIAHMVFFKLKEQTPNAREKLVAACDKLVSGMTGIVYYSAGVIGENYEPAVSVRDFDVALHLVFEDKAAHAKYLPHPQHKAFIDDNKATWAGVRVFDSEVQPRKK